jgi:cytochrome b involved in lipid metabolism
MLMMLVSSLVVLGIVSVAQARVIGGVDSGRALQGGVCNGVRLWTMAEVRAYPKQFGCLVVLYDTVYNLQAFADIHRGGPFSINRNCGKNATFGYESLVCIAGVPDHNRGILNMVKDDIVGYIKDSDADPCANSNPEPIPPPDFEDCTVYDVLQCDHLPSMPNGGKWTIDDVAQSTTGCVVALYNYVYDLGSPPQPNPFTPQNPGSLTFAEKHGGGPQPVLGRCNTDMTDVFENWVVRPGAPDHTKGSMNAIIGYLVGVIEGSDADPCVYPPPELTSSCDTSELTYWTMLDVRQSSTGCVSVVLGKVYDLEGFAPHHYGGSGEILEHCRQDITDDFFEKTFHTLVQLGAIQQFQIGVIQYGMAVHYTALRYSNTVAY